MVVSLRKQLGGLTKDTNSAPCYSFVSVKQGEDDLLILARSKEHRSACG